MRNPFGPKTIKPVLLAYDLDRTQSPEQTFNAGEGVPDERVRRALETLGKTYTVSAKQTYWTTVRWDDGPRTQSVAIASKTTMFRDREWRCVWSDAFSVPGKLSWTQALALLDDGDRHAFGGWCTVERDGETVVYFTASLPADAPPEELHDAIVMAAWQADNMEKATVGTDDN